MGRSLLVDGIIQLDNQTFKSYVETRYLFLFFVSLSLSLILKQFMEFDFPFLDYHVTRISRNLTNQSALFTWDDYFLVTWDFCLLEIDVIFT
jgi:hypothetical protein